MQFYQINSKQMPWGDYGNTLNYGFFTWDEAGNYFVERVGSFVPPIYYKFRHIIVLGETIVPIQKASLKGIDIKVVHKRKIVKLNWQKWDTNAPLLKTPPSGEPEDFIANRRHNQELADSLPDFWVIVPAKTGKAIVDKSKSYMDVSRIVLDSSAWDGSDVFGTPELGSVFCTEKAKKVFEELGTYLDFFAIKSLNSLS